ncbi:MAG: hypothetical protein HOV68_08295 [Streptomycetaceae bacterium]|nr:hypothetical protein [Streptomycetaceae bacterium]
MDAEEAAPTSGYALVGADGRTYRSDRPGVLGGHRRGRIYGRLDCRSALRAIAAGGYVRHRVFFADERDAIAAGYRPCAVCLPERYAAWKARPAPHTADELAAIISLLDASIAGTVVVGRGRDAASEQAARAFVDAWGERGGTVLAVVDWPETAASWLRHAQRFTSGTPDAWVVAAGPHGWARMSRRLRHSTDWDPGRTFGFASTGTITAVELAGAATLRGMRGASADGRTWSVGGELITYDVRG